MITLRQFSRSLPCLALVSFSVCAASPVFAVPVVQILRGSAQQGTYGSAFPEPLTVWVTDSVTRQPIAGTRVDFLPGRGIGLTPSYAITNGKGLASVTATGLEACTSEAYAEIAGLPGTRVQFSNLQVAKAPLTVVPDNIVSPTGTEIPVVANYSIVGFVNGDTVDSAHISGNPALTTTATNPGMHANYLIKGNPGSLSAPNYTFVAGYGTLAIVGGADSGGWISGQAAVDAASLSPEEEVPSVRPALGSDRGAGAEEQPAFIAGLRGESGVFVRAAIWSESASTTAVIRSQNTRSALLVNVSAAPQAESASVHAVALPTLAAVDSSTVALSTRTAFAPALEAVSTQPRVTAVRSAMLPAQSNAVPASSGASIRKALAVPASM